MHGATEMRETFFLWLQGYAEEWPLLLKLVCKSGSSVDRLAWRPGYIG